MKKIERLASRAREISQGRTWDVAVIESGNSEVDDLSTALNQMVTYLQGALEGERRNSLKMQEFIGDASHELRTPLTVIKGYVELLGNSNKLDDQAKKRSLERLTSEISRMERLITDLLLLAEIGEKKRVFDEAVNISDLLRIEITDLKLLEPERVIEDSITPEVYIVGHLPHIQQLFANIFSNVRRHTPMGSPLYVHLDYMKNGVRILIGDGGPGLPDEALKKGVQQFQRFDNSRSRESGGSGLGISIMRAIVTEHHGEMGFRKSRFGGLEIDIFFPLTGN
jgi:signal transduction histidine kinase